MTNVFQKTASLFPSLSPGEVHVWQVSLRTAPDLLPRLFETLLPDERARAKRFVFERDQNRHIVAHAALRYLIGNYLRVASADVQIALKQLGKPYIQTVNTSASLRFNLSHSDDFAVMAFCLGEELGIDIEHKRPEATSMDVAEHHFSKNELRDLEKLSEHDRVAGFFRCWTRKEAYLKARGVGLGVDLRSFDVSLESDETAELHAKDAEKWHVFPFKIDPDYWGALVYPRSKRDVRFYILDVPCIAQPADY